MSSQGERDKKRPPKATPLAAAPQSFTGLKMVLKQKMQEANLDTAELFSLSSKADILSLAAKHGIDLGVEGQQAARSVCSSKARPLPVLPSKPVLPVRPVQPRHLLVRRRRLLLPVQPILVV